MAKQILFDKFLIIECTAKELRDATAQQIVRCDYCGEVAIAHNFKGYYIAVLNQWFCKKCFDEWKEGAHWYPEDARIERKNFEFYAPRLGVKCH